MAEAISEPDMEPPTTRMVRFPDVGGAGFGVEGRSSVRERKDEEWMTGMPRGDCIIGFGGAAVLSGDGGGVVVVVERYSRS